MSVLNEGIPENMTIDPCTVCGEAILEVRQDTKVIEVGEVRPLWEGGPLWEDRSLGMTHLMPIQTIMTVHPCGHVQESIWLREKPKETQWVSARSQLWEKWNAWRKRLGRRTRR